jgi:hypothetical protein
MEKAFDGTDVIVDDPAAGVKERLPPAHPGTGAKIRILQVERLV